MFKFNAVEVLYDTNTKQPVQVVVRMTDAEFAQYAAATDKSAELHHPGSRQTFQVQHPVNVSPMVITEADGTQFHEVHFKL